MNSNELPLLKAFEHELERKGDLMQMNMRPATVISLVSVLQVALRHPSLTSDHPNPAAAARMFIECARSYFADCPNVRKVIDAGDDPRFDNMTPPQ